MFSRPLSFARFLRGLYGTAPFIDYCRQREIPFAQSGARPNRDALRRWETALTSLPLEHQARVELELARVSEMASPDGNDHLLEAAGGNALPPDDVPGDAALALWFFVHRPDLFREVFLHHQVECVDSWRQAHAAGASDLGDLEGKAGALAEALRASFAAREGARPFCEVQAHRFDDSVRFFAQVAQRPRFLDTFSDSGRATSLRLRRARSLLFVYSSTDGSVLLRCPLRSRQRIVCLFHLFGDHVLGCPVRWQDQLFDLDRLKQPFVLLPDAHDMHGVRLKSLHLRYPDRAGRRLLKLETLASDEPDAIAQMLARHVRDALVELRVFYAEIQVRLLADGRVRSHTIELWPDRCSLPETALGERLRACLKRWGLCHAR